MLAAFTDHAVEKFSRGPTCGEAEAYAGQRISGDAEAKGGLTSNTWPGAEGSKTDTRVSLSASYVSPSSLRTRRVCQAASGTPARRDARQVSFSVSSADRGPDTAKLKHCAKVELSREALRRGVAGSAQSPS
jgi:hypothetical protein